MSQEQTSYMKGSPLKNCSTTRNAQIQIHSLQKLVEEALVSIALSPELNAIDRQSDTEGYAREMDGHALQVSREDIADILLMANGAENLFVQQRNTPEHQRRVTNESYYTTGGTPRVWKKSLRSDGVRRFHWEQKGEYGVYRDEHGHARGVDGHIIHVSKDDIRNILERASMDEHSYICLPKHEKSFIQTKLVPEIYTKDEISEMLYGICGAQGKKEDDFQMKLDGVYYPLNDNISWLTTCLEEMRQDIARIQTEQLHYRRSIETSRHRSTMTQHHQSRRSSYQIFTPEQNLIR
ncbi:hypothetical protein DY000_02039936 [Brassica cretica]|uniref:Uncharacterized protein n=1 Tax=Brassica cretica TaxID=69181 RepID=A0ABQ7BPA3_BRACR|nr:hypothetical protein DY000_02039936 [Brassica cretica]